MKLYRIGIHDKQLNFSEKVENETIYQKKQDLMDIKCKIDTCDSKKWEEVKKKYNLYEYIYTSSKQNNNICDILPVSRSFFKLHEMIKNNHLLTNNIYCACLAEGPGGFIHCLNNYSKRYNIFIKKIYGITLISKEKSIPYWNQMILNHKTNCILNGVDKSSTSGVATVNTVPMQTTGGGNVGTGDGRYCNADIALFRLYDRALSNDEIVQNYNAEKLRFHNYATTFTPSCSGNKGKVAYLTSANNIKLIKKIVPECRLYIETEIKSYKRGLAICQGQGIIENKTVCKADFNLILPDELKKYNLKT